MTGAIYDPQREFLSDTGSVSILTSGSPPCRKIINHLGDDISLLPHMGTQASSFVPFWGPGCGNVFPGV